MRATRLVLVALTVSALTSCVHPPRPPAIAAAPPVPPACNCRTQPTAQYPPYSAHQKTTRVQTLGDGTTLTHIDEAILARDSSGRTRTETIRREPDGLEIHFFNVFDPVKNRRFTWTVGRESTPKTVFVYSVVNRTQPVAGQPVRPRAYFPYRNESMPPTTIEGLYVEGTRTVRTTPAGYDGSDRDISVTSDSWFSPDLRIAIRTVMDDPRNGKSTMETSDIQQTAPDPRLFELPEGYTVKEMSPAQ